MAYVSSLFVHIPNSLCSFFEPTLAYTYVPTCAYTYVHTFAYTYVPTFAYTYVPSFRLISTTLSMYITPRVFF